MSSTIPTASTSQHEEEQEQEPVHSSLVTTSPPSMSSTPILPSFDVQLTENEHEDNLMELIDQLIHNFLKDTPRRSPYRTYCRWTCEHEQGLSYSVTIKIEEPSPMTHH